MNKIISANINGFVFQIDELAYAKLKAYLEVIKQKVGNAEVVQDIENRIAELFNEKLKSGTTAIFDKDVEEVMQQIGKPEQFGSEEQDEQTETEQAASDKHDKKANRRLYRDEDDKVVGGVCSGIAAYFGLDPVIVRLGFVATFLFFGSGFVLYILLMIVIPKAVTPSEKLQMRGEPIDYKNLSKTVEKDFKDAYHRYKPEVKTGFHRFVEIAVRVGMVMLFIFLISIFVPGCFGILTGIGVASWSLPTLGSYLFTNETESITILLGLSLFILIPVFGLLYSLLRFALKFKPMPKFISIGLSALWFTGFCLLAYSTYNIGMQFSSTSKETHTDTLKTTTYSGNKLILRCTDGSEYSRFIIHDEDGESQINIHNQNDMKEAIDREISEQVRLNIIHGFSAFPVLKVSKQSNGRNEKEALAFAETIQYHYELKDSILYLDDVFQRGTQPLWRNQKVKLTLEVPESYKLYIDRSCRKLLHIRRYHEDELLGRYMKVDSKGIHAIN